MMNVCAGEFGVRSMVGMDGWVVRRVLIFGFCFRVLQVDVEVGRRSVSGTFVGEGRREREP